MVITVVSFKGGVGKTTTSIHLAGVLAERAPTLLIDLDYNQSATEWAAAGHLPFQVASTADARGLLSEYRDGHVVIDTPARPDRDELGKLAKRGDLLVVPTTPDALAIRALTRTVRLLRERGSRPFKVLLTVVPPFPSRDGKRARAALEKAGLTLFRREIPRAAVFHKAALQGCLVSEVTDRKSMLSWIAYSDVVNEALNER